MREELERLRKLGLTQAQIAERKGISVSAVRKILKGERSGTARKR